MRAETGIGTREIHTSAILFHTREETPRLQGLSKELKEQKAKDKPPKS
jgi:hypothetical protein